MDTLSVQSSSESQPLLIKQSSFSQPKILRSSHPLSLFQSLFNIKLIYQKERFKALESDFKAAITVVCILIPQAIAYSQIAGVQPRHGLFSSIIAPLCYLFLGSSAVITLGPAAIDELVISSLVLGLVDNDVIPFSEEWESYIFCFTFLAGLYQFLFGFFNLSFLAEFISRPTLRAFTSSAAIMIGLTQIPTFFGFVHPVPRDSNAFIHLYHVFANFNSLHWPSLLLGIACFIILYLRKVWIGKKWKYYKMLQVLPISLFVLISSALFALLDEDIEKIGLIPHELPPIIFPLTFLGKMNSSQILKMFFDAFVLALIGYIELISAARQLDLNHLEYELNSRTEFYAIGIANMLSSLFSGIVNSSGLSRAGVQFEAKPRSTLIEGFLFLFVISITFGLGPYFSYLPRPALAAIILVGCFSLFNTSTPKFLYKHSKLEFGIYCLVFLAVLNFGFAIGVLLGIISSFGYVVSGFLNPRSCVVKISSSSDSLDTSDTSLAPIQPYSVIQITSPIFFANSSTIVDQLSLFLQDSSILLVDMSLVNAFDHTALVKFESLFQDLDSKSFIHLYSLQPKIKVYLDESTVQFPIFETQSQALDGIDRSIE